MTQEINEMAVRKKAEDQVTRDLGYRPHPGGEGYVAMTWGVAALGVLMLSAAVASVYAILGVGDYSLDTGLEELPHITVTAAIVVAVGYFYESKRSSKWYSRFEEQLSSLR